MSAVNIRAVNALIAQQRPEDRTDDLIQARADFLRAVFDKECKFGLCPAVWDALPDLTYKQAEYEAKLAGRSS